MTPDLKALVDRCAISGALDPDVIALVAGLVAEIERLENLHRDLL